MVSESDVRKRDLLEATYPKNTVEIKPDTLPYDYEKIFLRKKFEKANETAGDKRKFIAQGHCFSADEFTLLAHSYCNLNTGKNFAHIFP